MWHTFRGVQDLWQFVTGGGKKSSKIAWHTLCTAPSFFSSFSFFPYSARRGHFTFRWGGGRPPSVPLATGGPAAAPMYKKYTVLNSDLLHGVEIHFKFSNLLIFTLCLQDHPIHRFCPSHMSEHLWVKGPFLSLLQDSGTPSHQTTRYLFLHSAQNSKPIFSS